MANYYYYYKASTFPVFSYILIIFLSPLFSIITKFSPPWNPLPPPPPLPYNHHPYPFPPNITTTVPVRVDPETIRTASSDFGKLVQETPAGVLYPSSVSDIINIIKLSYKSSVPFPIAARGHGHSVRGQAMAKNGVVVDMSSLNNNNETRVNVSWSQSLGHFADVGGEQLWIDVLRGTLKYNLAPVSWTDYLYLTVGGTLSNGGMSGQSFLHGPQINNVHELDIITGTGEFITCSKHKNWELFYGVLGGLGQFGIITRARIVLDKAPTRVKWMRMLYDDFSTFTKDQEHLISIINGLDYVEGSLIMHQSPPNNWRSSFFTQSHQSKIASILNKTKILYSLEVVKYYDDHTLDSVEEELELLLGNLKYISDFKFKKDVTYVDFLNRVRSGELKLQAKGLWDVPHPWLNIFVPKYRMKDFNDGVFMDILANSTKIGGPVLVYPLSNKKWDVRMSAVTPEGDTFYYVGLLHSSSGTGDQEIWEDQNTKILDFCDENGIEIKQYLPHYNTKENWMKHFGKKWTKFQERKARFDPKKILAPGQKIFMQ